MSRPEIVARAEQACAQLAGSGQPVSFAAVAARTGTSRATLYRDPALRALVE
jgi:predicted DNA-binding transcriptional regulator YafY